jgi:hypothetical protein
MEFENTNNNEAMKMDHEEATRLQACTRYLMGGLSGAEAAAFEEHFFTCANCAEELKAGAVFAEDVRAVFHEQAQGLAKASPAVPPQAGPGWFEKMRLAFALPWAAAAVALLALVIYQNAVFIPGLRSEVAELSMPQSLPQIPLKIDRGLAPVSLPKGQSFWLAYFVLPPETRFPANCDIVSSRGTKTVLLTAPALGQPSSLLLRTADFPRGRYSFKVRNPQSDSIIASYTLDISPQ